MRGGLAIIARKRVAMASLPLISQRAGPPTASPKGEAIQREKPQLHDRSCGFVLAYTRPTYLLYHKQHVLFNPEYAQILHSKIVGSANRRNTKAVI